MPATETHSQPGPTCAELMKDPFSSRLMDLIIPRRLVFLSQQGTGAGMGSREERAPGGQGCKDGVDALQGQQVHRAQTAADRESSLG